jgi:hypothetical protein
LIEIIKEHDGHEENDFKLLIIGRNVYIISSKGIKQILYVNNGENGRTNNFLSNNSTDNISKNNSKMNVTYRTVLNFTK